MSWFGRNKNTPQPNTTPTPYVNFKSIAKTYIDSFGAPIVASEVDTVTVMVDSLWLCNRLSEDVIVNVKLWKEQEDPNHIHETFLARQLPLKPYERIDLLSGSCLYLNPYDLLYAYSDELDHYFDCIVSYRELVQ